MDLNSSPTHEQNRDASSLESSVAGDIFTDRSRELSEPDQGAHASSPDIAAQSPIAPPRALRTVDEMTTQGLTLKHQTQALISNIRGHQARAKSLAPEWGAAKLADILPISGPAPLLQFPPTTRAIGPTGRIRLRINNQSLRDHLGWGPGPLRVSLDGAWVILRPDFSEKVRRRHDGGCTYTADERLRLSEAVCTYLGTPPGQEVALLLLPEHQALALVNPSRLLTGAPLSLFDPSSTANHGGN